MGINRAYEALTNPNPSNRQFLVRFIAERAIRRISPPNTVQKDDIWYLICILQRWGFITGEDMPALSRKTLGGLVQDAYDAAKILQVESV